MTDARPRVLVIEDDRDVATMMQVTLRRAGYDVSLEHGGDAGVEHAVREQPDVIVLDLRMAPVDGYEVLERLRADDRTASVPVVVASILEGEERARLGGASLFVKKPFAAGEIAEAVAKVLDRNGT